MTILEILEQAIAEKKPISFTYNKDGRIQSNRIGNTHAVYIFTAISGEQSTKVDIFQTGGDSDTKNEKPLPSWRIFKIEDILNVVILNNEPDFLPAEGYKPESDRYKNVIAKI